jgi:hypothetical protein
MSFVMTAATKDHQLAIEQVVPSVLLPEIVNTAGGVDFLLASHGGYLLEVIAPDRLRDGAITDKAHHVFGQQVFDGVVRPPKQGKRFCAAGLPRPEERANEGALPDAANASVGVAQRP